MEKKEYTIYTLKEIESMLSVTQRTLYNWIKQKKLDAVKMGGQYRVTQEALDKFLQGDK